MTDSDRRTRALKALNTVATDLKSCETPTAVCERSVAAAQAVLEMDVCVINLEEDGTLPIVALSADVPPDGATPMSITEGLVGLAYREGRTINTADVRESPEANPQGPYRSALTVPIGSYGVFQAVSGDVDDFDETDRELAELLTAHCHAALERLDREAEIREHARSLERQNERLAQFANVVSHDLRNPLSVLEGYLELARETGEPQYFDRCTASIDRMNRLVDDLLTLAREGASIDDRGTVDLATLAERCWENVETGETELVVADTLLLEADADRLQQLFENLFRNAVEHGPGDDSDRPITLTVGPLPDLDGFYVADDGVGVDPEDRDRVLEPGYSTSADGTGFGLGIVSEVATGHDWSIDVTSAESGGARFEFADVTTFDDAEPDLDADASPLNDGVDSSGTGDARSDSST